MSMAVQTDERWEGVSLERIPIDRMEIAPEYQRLPHEHRIEVMAGKWDDDAAGALYVCRAPGIGKNYKVFVMDGQHRMLAAKKAGVESLWCFVFPVKTKAEQARLFVLFNRDRHSANPLVVFKAQIAQGDEMSKDIEHIIKTALGVEIALGATTFMAVRTAEEMYKRLGRSKMHAIFRVVADAWPGQVRAQSDYVILRALTVFVLHYGEEKIDWDTLRDALHRTTVADIRRVANARMLRKSRGADETKAVPNVAEVILELYNKQAGGRKRQLLQPRSLAVFAKEWYRFAGRGKARKK